MLGYDARASAHWGEPRRRRRDRMAAFGSSVVFVFGAFATGGGMALSSAYFA